MLRHLGLKAGQTLLILGAGGSVGTIAVQLAAARASTSSGRRPRATSGAWPGSAPPRSATATAGPTASGRRRRAGSTRSSTRPGPAVADAIALAGDAARVITIADDNAAGHGVRFTGADPADRAPEALPELAALMAGGRPAVPIWRTYPLARAAQAHADLEARRNHGKIVLLP